MSNTLTDTKTFTVITCSSTGCGVSFALDDAYIEARRRDRATWYCPNGHSRWYPGETTEQKLKRAEARATHLSDQRDAAERSARAYKGQATKLRKKVERVEAGVCPHCSRSFQDLRRHMESQHRDHA